MSARFWFDPCQFCGLPVDLDEEKDSGNSFRLARSCTNPACPARADDSPRRVSDYTGAGAVA